MEGIIAIMDQVMGEASGVEAVGVESGNTPLVRILELWAALSVLLNLTITI